MSVSKPALFWESYGDFLRITLMFSKIFFLFVIYEQVATVYTVIVTVIPAKNYYIYIIYLNILCSPSRKQHKTATKTLADKNWSHYHYWKLIRWLGIGWLGHVVSHTVVVISTTGAFRRRNKISLLDLNYDNPYWQGTCIYVRWHQDLSGFGLSNSGPQQNMYYSKLLKTVYPAFDWHMPAKLWLKSWLLIWLV